MQNLRYGMVGGGPGGNIGAAHRKALYLSGQVIPAAGCFSRSQDKNLLMGQELGIDSERCYKDYQEMACAESGRNDGIDFVVIVTPNNSHYEICKTFLEAGIPVACDKPLTLQVEQAEELETLAQKKNLPFMVTYTYTGHHMFRKFRQMLRDGKIGNIRKVIAEYPQSWLADADSDGGKQGRWRMDPAQTGRTNCLGDIGSHVEHAVTTATGLEIDRVLATMNRVVPGRILDDDDVVLVQFKSGQTGMFWTSQFAYGSDNDLKIRVIGENGTLIWSLADPCSLLHYNCNNQLQVLHPVPEEKILYGEYEVPEEFTPWNVAMSNLYTLFMKQIRERNIEADYPTVSEGVQSLRYIEACLKSQSTGNSWVPVEAK